MVSSLFVLFVCLCVFHTLFCYHVTLVYSSTCCCRTVSALPASRYLSFCSHSYLWTGGSDRPAERTDRRALGVGAGAGGRRAVRSPQRGEHGHAHRPQPPNRAHVRRRLLEGVCLSACGRAFLRKQQVYTSCMFEVHSSLAFFLSV